MANNRAPTVSELVAVPSVFVTRPVPPPREAVKPDFDTDVLWKPIRLGGRQRTVSVDSTDSAATESDSRRVSVTGELSPGISQSPGEGGRTRKLSFSEMIFGSPKGGFSWGQATVQKATMEGNPVTDDVRFKELLKHQSQILNDEGVFKRSDYRKK